MSTNTFSSTAKLGEYFAKLPACKADGTNWIFFRDRFLFAVDAAGLSDHFEDVVTATEPTAPAVVDPKNPTADETKAINEYAKKCQIWKSEQAVIKQGIASVISDSLFLKVKGEATAKAMWEKVKSEYEKKSKMVTVDLRRKLQDERCAEGGDVKTHLTKLQSICEDLIAMGADPGDDNFVAIVLGSLPASFETYLSALTGASTLLGKALDPDMVLQGINDEADRRKVRSAGKGEKESAFYSGNSGKKSRKSVECYNCHRKGHMVRDCWAKGGGKEGQGPRKGHGQANSAKADKEFDAAWFAEEEDDEEDFSDLPSLQDVSDSEDEDSDNEVDELDISTPELIGEITSLTSGNLAVAVADTEREHEVDIFDSGATQHMTPSRHRLMNYMAIKPRGIMAADKKKFEALGKGDMYITIPNGKNQTTKVLVKDVLHAPNLRVTLLSVGRITQAGYSLDFKDEECRIFDKKHHQIGSIPHVNGLYRLRVPVPHPEAYHVDDGPCIVTPDELHRLMGHLPVDAAKKLVKDQLVDGLELDEGSPTSKDQCPSCLHGRMTRKAVSKSRENDASGGVGDQVHSDVWGPATIETPQHKKYYVTFTDDASRYSVAMLLHSKDETLQSFKDLEARWDKVHGIKIKILHSDGGGEYKSHAFDDYLAEKGIQRHFTVHDTPEHNGVAERLNRTLLEKVRAMLHAAGLPNNLWGEALKHAIWLKNRTLSKAIGGRTPYEVFHGSKPDLRHIHEWGCKVWVHVEDGSKLEGRAREGQWLGFDQDSNGHRIYYPNNHSIRVERSVKFPEMRRSEGGIHKVLNEGENAAVSDEKKTENIQHAPALPKPTPLSLPGSPLTTPPDTPPSSPMSKPIPPIAPQDISSKIDVQNIIEGTRTHRAAHLVQAEPVADSVVTEYAYLAMGDMSDEPSVEEAMQREDWLLFKQAMDVEMEAMKRTGTFGDGPTPRPIGCNIVGSKWALRIKRKANGEIDKYKARLIAHGFTQVQGVDYFETFSPTAKLSSLRTFLSIATHYNWDIKLFDYSAAFLNGEFSDNEEIYMEQPPHYTNGNPNEVIRLRRTIYGLKQSRFHALHNDHAVYRLIRGDDIILMAIHIDDSTIIGTSPTLIDEIQEEIAQIFKITMLGPLNWLLGMEVKRDRKNHTLSISQTTYIDSLLRKFGMTDCKSVSVPLDPMTQISREQCPNTPSDVADMRDIPYRELIGGLIWLSTATRPDLAFTVCVLSRFLDNPGRPHWN
ncbi:uncharacterized protein ARMOST_05573 [Armillaria ostoyae]|uniref:Uncharacterized protein n=1 Tax=Armillaria ostoyae TaxID=47428 RepID=A0A284R0J7_ARMOS|nr:uncharacterized protein ARMOST_05573 [Armillaria ostoyae]